MTINTLIAEIKSGGFRAYDESNLIDDISLRTWIKNEMKRFGANIMILNDSIIKISNNKGKLPENFWQLNLALKCEPSHYEINGDKAKLQKSLFFKERIEGDLVWDNFSESFYGDNAKFFREDLYFEDNGYVSFFYHNPRLLKLTKGFDRRVCHKDCPNLDRSLIEGEVDEINITNNFINTNFKSGVIYMQYYGFQLDEEGDIIIPETQHNRLKEYLIYYCRTRILEDLISGDDEPNKINLLNYYNQKTAENLLLAMTETKFEGLGKGWATKVRNKNKIHTSKFERMLPNR